ncbi:MAG: TonB-dependent receptor [Xanthomonadales bacterium]|nr:TonB-dependent receptor [Xanthomonadales bacterium]
MRKSLLSLALVHALASLAFSHGAHAEAAGAGNEDAGAEKLEAIEVRGEIIYRDRADAIAPTLSYDLEYFQRFEPLTAGDMLKRVPSVAFVSDVLEYDGARLRGLDPGYTQILINGKKVPGAGTDRSFFVDRIPAEMVERIEIVRSTSANRSGDAVAGAINIVLRDAYEFDGGYARVGGLYFDDGRVKPTYGAVNSGEFAGGRVLAGFNVQGRYNPKQKRSDRYDAPGGDYADREDQSDIRNGTDYSANLSFTREFEHGELKLDALYVMTDRTEDEQSTEYVDIASTELTDLLSYNEQLVTIDQHNAALGLSYEFDLAGGESEIDIDWANFSDGRFDTEEEIRYRAGQNPPRFRDYQGTRVLTDGDDSELALKLAHAREIGAAEMEFGLDFNKKDRDSRLLTSEVEADGAGLPLPAYEAFALDDSNIQERRLAPYLMFTGERGDFDWEAGIRYERTDVDVRADSDRYDNRYAEVLPSAHLRWNLGNENRLNVSLGRTLRRPNFNQLLPVLLEGEFGDNDFIGNALLDPETANGIDIGFERRLGLQGIVGINFFYRDVQDLIEVVNTGEPSDEALGDYEDEVEEFLDENPGAGPTTPGYPVLDPESFVYSVANVGDGYVYGFEFDLSTPLSAFGLDDTGVFLNYSWLDSEVEDEIGPRMFNDQAKSVFNVGFIQDLPSWNAAFGASYRRQGDAFSRVLAEEVATQYGADLEVFVEERFGKQMALRLTGSNLLDASKDEQFNKFDTLTDQIDRDFDEYEVETESAGPVVQLIARYTF